MPDIGTIVRIGQYSTKYIWIECPYCHEQRWMRFQNYKRGGETGQCRKCWDRLFAKPPHPAGLKPEIMCQGYVLLRVPGHPRPKCRGRVKRAVLVMEKQLSRYLEHDEHVHHINGKRDDDRSENLMVLTKSEHSRLHEAMKRNARNHLSYGQGLLEVLAKRRTR